MPSGVRARLFRRKERAFHNHLQFFHQEWLGKKWQSRLFQKFQSARGKRIAGNEQQPVAHGASLRHQLAIDRASIEMRHAQIANNQRVISSGGAIESIETGMESPARFGLINFREEDELRNFVRHVANGKV